MKVHSPIIENVPQRIPIAQRGKAIEGQVWGFVDTSKVNADLFIEELQAKIREKYGPRDFIVIRKQSPGFPLSPEQTDKLARECGFVVFCFGD